MFRAWQARSRARGPRQVFERVTGTFNGYHVAAYAAERRPGSGVYTAFYKVCDGVPGDYWRSHCLFKGVTPQGYPTPTDALVAADALAQHAIGNLPPLDKLRARDPVDLFRFPGLDQWPLRMGA